MAKKFALMKRIGYGWQQVVIDNKNKDWYKKTWLEMKGGASRSYHIEISRDNASGLTFYKADDILIIECNNDFVNVSLDGNFTPVGAWSIFPRDGVIQKGVTFFKLVGLYEFEAVD